MNSIICKSCGSNELTEIDGYLVCDYCGTKHETEKSGAVTIDLDSDVQELLEKCRRNPDKARKYAELILEIDPFNKEAKRYL